MIFSVGLPRTGNQSLQAALRKLGYRCGHDASPLSRLADFSACVEVRFPIADLERAYPSSLYVFTARTDKAAWLRSCEAAQKIATPAWNPFWQIPAADRLKAYADREREVRSTVPSTRLLVFDVYLQQWGPLCGFLGRPVPDEPFPRVDKVK